MGFLIFYAVIRDFLIRCKKSLPNTRKYTCKIEEKLILAFGSRKSFVRVDLVVPRPTKKKI
jgi:hypothetical protein